MFGLTCRSPPEQERAAARAASSLEDMAIFLFEADRLAPRPMPPGAAGRCRRRRRPAGAPADCLAIGGTPVSVRPSRNRSASFGGCTRSVGTLRAAARDRAHQPRRDDDHQLGLFLLEAGRAEQRADDRHRAEDRELPDRVLEIAAEQAGQREAFAVAQLDRRSARGGSAGPGCVRLLMTIDAVGSIELTSGATTMLITPSASTVGVNARLTPNGFHSTVSAVDCRRRRRRRRPATTGTGNSPPARKLAVSPDSATSVGSASVVIAPLRSSASSVASMFEPEDVERPREDAEAVDDRARATGPGRRAWSS